MADSAWQRIAVTAAALWSLALCLLCGLAAAQTITATPTTHVVGPEGQPDSLQAALMRAADGDVIELLPGSYDGLILVLENRRLVFRGLGSTRPVFNGQGRMGEYKALWTVRGGDITVENIEFRGARSGEAQGAGIRLESGRLTVRGSRFQDNEHGIHAQNDAQAELLIENSEFGLAPKVVGGLHHLLNVGRIARLSIRGSRFQQGFEGHLIKSRAAVTDIRYNMIHDGGRGGASYEVELPAGGEATLIGNVIGQGRDSQNPVMVAFGSDVGTWPRSSLRMAHNTLLNYKRLPAWFLRTWPDNLPQGTAVVAVNNLLVGSGFFGLVNRGHFEGNAHAAFWMLRDADTYAFELDSDAHWRGRGVDPAQAPGGSLAPQAEFMWPVGVEPLPERSRWSPGASQK